MPRIQGVAAAEASTAAVAVDQLEAVAGAATAEEVNTKMHPLKETLQVEAAAAAAAARILHHLMPSSTTHTAARPSAAIAAVAAAASALPTASAASAAGDELEHESREQLKACRMARAMCLAGRVAALGSAGVPQRLLALLTSDHVPAVVRGACAEALVSMALRHACVGDAVAGAAAQPSSNVAKSPSVPTASGASPVTASSPADTAGSAASFSPAAQLLDALLKLHSTGADVPASTAAGTASRAPGLEEDQNQSLETEIHSGASVLAGGAVGPSIMRLIITLSQHKRAMAALMKAGLLPALVTLIEAPGHTKVPDSGAGTGNAAEGAGSSQASTSDSTSAAASTAAGSKRPLNRTLQRAALHYILNLTAHVPMHAPLLHAGLLKALAPSLSPATPVPVLEPACAIVSNVSLGGAAQQQEVVKSGLVPVLARLLTHTNTHVVCHTIDALANTLMHNPTAQAALAAAACPLPGRPAVVGRAATAAAKEAKEAAAGSGAVVPGTSGARDSSNTSPDRLGCSSGDTKGMAGAGAGAGEADAGSSRPMVVGGVAALVRLLHSRDVAVVAKTLRALGNAVLNHPPNQQALLATGVTPALVALARYDDAPPVCRQALHLLANLVASNPAAQRAAIKAGALQAAAHALARAASATAASPSTSPPSKVATSSVLPEGSDPAGSGSDSGSPPRSGSSGVGSGITERACLLLANLCAAGSDAKAALKDAGVLPVLVGLVAAVGSTATSATATSAASQGSAASEAGTQQEASPSPANLKAARQRTASAAAAAATLANLCLREPGCQAEVVKAGGMAALCAAVSASAAALTASRAWQPAPAAADLKAQHVDLVSKACHALGSLTQGCEEAVTAAIAAGAPALLASLFKVCRIMLCAVPCAFVRVLCLICRFHQLMASSVVCQGLDVCMMYSHDVQMYSANSMHAGTTDPCSHST